MPRHLKNPARCAAIIALLALAMNVPTTASSHREAPFVTEHPKVDGTDFYMFRSYESGREGFVVAYSGLRQRRLELYCRRRYRMTQDQAPGVKG